MCCRPTHMESSQTCTLGLLCPSGTSHWEVLNEHENTRSIEHFERPIQQCSAAHECHIFRSLMQLDMQGSTFLHKSVKLKTHRDPALHTLTQMFRINQFGANFEEIRLRELNSCARDVRAARFVRHHLSSIPTYSVLTRPR